MIRRTSFSIRMNRTVKLTRSRIVTVIPLVREQAQEGGGFAGLSGSSEHDDWPRPRGALQPGFDSARDPHTQNIR